MDPSNNNLIYSLLILLDMYQIVFYSSCSLMERGTHCAELISSIESIYNHQKERYNEQLRLLYEV